MDTELRRKKIASLLEVADTPLRASALAEQLHVSRQIIVGDVALLRAKGLHITATPKGYLLDVHQTPYPYVGLVVCKHTAEQMQEELYTIVDRGGVVMDVTVEHGVYGQLSGLLNLASRYDVDLFLEKISKEGAKPLSDLTNGIHLHQIGCQSAAAFDIIRGKLLELDICY